MSEISDNTDEEHAIESVYETDHEVGEHNVEIMGMDLHNPVFFSSALLIFLFVFLTLLFPESAKEAFDSSKSWSINNFEK